MRRPPKKRKAEPSVALLLKNRGRFLRFLQTHIGDPDAAEDVLQQGFLRAVKSAGRLRQKEAVVAWFFRVLRNLVTDYYRTRASDQNKRDALARDLRDASEPPAALERRVCRCMHGLLPGLRPTYAELVERIDLKKEPLSRVAKSLRVSENNTHVRLHRARQALKASLISSCGSCAEHGCLDCHCKR